MTSATDVLAVSKALEQTQTIRQFKKILCVWLKISLSLTSKQIAIGIGMTPSAVRQTQARFAKYGVQILSPRPKGGRKRENISYSREKQILDKFLRRAQRGSVLNVAEVQKAYELSAGKTVPRSTIYRLIARHGLRRYLPRARASR